MAANLKVMPTDWLCLSCLLAEKKTPAVTMWHGTAFCEACTGKAFAAAEREVAHVVHAPMPTTWPRISRPVKD